MASEDRELRDAVKNAKSAFYTNKKRQKKLSRKDARRKNRLEKKSKQHEYLLKKYSKEVEQPPENAEIKKKRKRKRKRKVQTVEDKDIDLERAAYEAANKQDEKILSTLGKKLKVTNKTDLMKMFKEDGLDYILEVCEPLSQEQYDNSSDEEYMASKTAKKKKTLTKKKLSNDDDDDVDENVDRNHQLLFDDGTAYEDEEILAQGSIADSDEEDDDDLDKLSSAETEHLDEEVSSANEEEEEDVKESQNVTKYVPPALRKLKQKNEDQDKIKQDRIKKKLKGLLNRVSSATLPGVTSNIEKLYLENSRNMMNEILYQLICDACIMESLVPQRLVIEHITIVAVLHNTIGSEVGSYFLQMLVERFCSLHQDGPSYGEGKQCQNILLLLTSLYLFKVVDCLLVYDIIQRLLKNFHEQDIEMILLILKVCGSEIRKDDPGTLKDIILQVQAKSITSQVQDQSRVRFMLETINALKNNNLRKIQHDSTLLEEARKVFKLSLKGKGNSSGVQLKVSLVDLLNAREKGKWWVVGAAWTGREPTEKTESTNNPQTDEGSRVLEVAKKQRMNTNLRKNIFCTMMTSEDYADAFERLLKLNLKEKQAREIIHVLLDCCMQEQTYNPFYAHLAGKFCEYSRSHQVTLQYTLWDRFKVLSTLSKHNLNNMALLLAHLVSSKHLSLAVLKVVSFGVLDKPSIKFFINFFKILLLQYPETVSKAVFQRISNDQKLSLLREGVKVFLKHFLYPRKTSDEGFDMQQEKIKELIEISDAALDGHEYVPL
ncbi:nucleolar MIF4G domain-containing protein 1-like isoform X2 [Hydractinia symbiolongicarpus]|uniref:nucleolar MIF4G domain-containing protein 1-like isoform X2 n=1 Tax=Hydractinia symbiolongicarpus TaxID=13093 RepID=UPI00254B53F3|nr:nucleolar MIF4G domain-containing protein 1-like isoform X2 [Hydractinia symbiolongicarpus]